MSFKIGFWGESQSDKYNKNIFVDKLIEIANSFRQTLITSTDRMEVSRELLSMNKYIHFDTICEETFHYGKPFTWWRCLRKNEQELYIINQICSRIISGKIDIIVKELMDDI